MYKSPFPAEASALSDSATQHIYVRAVGWEPHGCDRTSTTCAGKADHGFGVYVPRALICLLKTENQTVLLHKEFEIPTLHSKFCRDIEVRVFVRSCAQVILRKI